MPNIGHIFAELYRTYPLFLEALVVTLQLTIASILIGTIIGLFVALLKLSHLPGGKWVADFYITIVRATPLIVQIFVLYFGLKNVIDLGQFWSAALALAFHNGAYIAEIFRGTIQSIDKGQMEAGRSLGMTKTLTMRRIILPQAFKRAIPPLGNQFIIGLKDSSLAAFIAMNELFAQARRLAAATYDEMTFYIIVAIYYLVLVLIFSFIVNKVEKKLAAGD
ncbi:amino acid ABC transporter permease [Bacillus taeanensis]|uniref:Amino acid ABC transporter permease n=1 Tax=Bacillus taeanensis TaxID=273032 RepID=A0A366XZJ3_9BACI|nr:amino acid ABC transporter permease [Bacillus taeanensis]RBW71572.1 amino acid ABC transporter permease [Bacillus taeanensis]